MKIRNGIIIHWSQAGKLSNDHFYITKDLIVKIKGNGVETGSVYALVRTFIENAFCCEITPKLSLLCQKSWSLSPFY